MMTKGDQGTLHGSLRHRTRPRRVPAILALTFALGSTGCDLEFFQLVSASDPDTERAFLLLADRNVGFGPARLPGVAGDVGLVRYSTNDEHRPFLFEGDLGAGISSGRFLHLPQDRMDELFREERIADPARWQSFRVYDAGLCSLPGIWTLFAQRFLDGFARGFVQNVRIEGGQLVEGTLTPIVSGAGFLFDGADRIHAEFTLHADHVETIGVHPFDCGDVTFDIVLEFSYRRASGGVLSTAPIFPPRPLPPGWPEEECPPGTGATVRRIQPDGVTQDYDGVLQELDVHVDGCGVFDGRLADEFEEGIRESFPANVSRGLREGLLRDPRELGIPESRIRPCACDRQCNDYARDGPAYPGKRHSCVVRQLFPTVSGECWFQLEPDRLNARPEMLEIVTIRSTDDPQAEVVTFDWDGDGRPGGGVVGNLMCEPGRSAVPVDDPAREGTMAFPIRCAPDEVSGVLECSATP